MYAAMPCLSPCGTSTVAACSLSLRRPLPSHRLSLLSLLSRPCANAQDSLFCVAAVFGSYLY